MLVAHPAHQGSAVIFIRPSTSLEIKDTHGSLKLKLMLMSCVISCVIASAKSNSFMQSSPADNLVFPHLLQGSSSLEAEAPYLGLGGDRVKSTSCAHLGHFPTRSFIVI